MIVAFLPLRPFTVNFNEIHMFLDWSARVNLALASDLFILQGIFLEHAEELHIIILRRSSKFQNRPKNKGTKRPIQGGQTFTYTNLSIENNITTTQARQSSTLRHRPYTLYQMSALHLAQQTDGWEQPHKKTQVFLCFQIRQATNITRELKPFLDCF